MTDRRRVHIAHLVLPAGALGRDRTRAAVEREVARALAAAPETAQPTGELNFATIDARVQSSSSPHALGLAAAAAIRDRLKG